MGDAKARSVKQVLQKLLSENKELKKENRRLEDKIGELSFLSRMDHNLDNNFERQNFYQKIVKMALRMSNTEVGGLFLISPVNQQLTMKVYEGDIEPSVIKWLEKMPKDIEKILINSQTKVLVKNGPILKELQRRDPYIKSALFYPLNFTRDHLGLGFVMHRHEGLKEHPNHFDEDMNFLSILAKQAHLMVELNNLKYERANQNIYLNTIRALTEAIDAKDMYTAGHSQRVAEISTTIAYQLGLTQREIDVIHYGALLHDIGKIGIPESILNKNGRLTNKEFKNVKRHPKIGTNILRSIDFLEEALHIVRHHHERYDGGGYPDGKHGEEIPFMARIVCVADAWDAMTSNRSYRKALPFEVVLEEFDQNKGTQFDPIIIRTLQRRSFGELKVI